jgi:eukaryotic-like serine/threonine-protein kinase
MAWISGQPIHNGKYVVERQLGQGRFGTTYLVKNQESERCVIKTLNDSLLQSLSQAERDRLETLFWQEAVKLTRCNHPHIVKAGAPFKEQNQWCIAMEYVDGTSLAERSQPMLPEAEAIAYIQQIGEALTVVHDHQLIHRDVNPGNIMLRAGKPDAVLIDFGLALEFDHTLTAARTQETSDGFTALELYSNQTQPVGAYTDVYSLAATLYDLLTGKKPVSAVKRKLNNARLLAPKEVNPLVSDRTSRVILQGMELDRSKRPQSVQEWLEALGVAQAMPSPPVAQSTQSSSRSLEEKIKIWTLIIAGVAAIGGLLGGLSGWIAIFKPSLPQSSPSPAQSPQQTPLSVKTP